MESLLAKESPHGTSGTTGEKQLSVRVVRIIQLLMLPSATCATSVRCSERLPQNEANTDETRVKRRGDNEGDLSTCEDLDPNQQPEASSPQTFQLYGPIPSFLANAYLSCVSIT